MKGSSPLNNKIAKPRDHFENVTKLYKAIEKGELKTLSTIEPQNILEARFTNVRIYFTQGLYNYTHSTNVMPSTWLSGFNTLC